MDDKVTLITDHGDNRLRWRANYRGVLAAELTADIDGNNAVLHNRVYLWNKSLCREYQTIYCRVREQLKELGIRLVMVCSDHYTVTMGHYWRMMGFKIFYDVQAPGGITIPCAVMEV
ncbi:hypothetical protein F6V25_07990 [Oryzomonas japonica]|uniref:Uncharacterized protein n=1 Tax=Oryzomonas japonica TaxID=2603858 RepID=A0A7J4ZRB7_9BACT|nr:hypothetical protein [Oryzomonas japonica]KAB0665653.1 hypothetical protein F6V25_07990 [Oryzomonas japonica]